MKSEKISKVITIHPEGDMSTKLCTIKDDIHSSYWDQTKNSLNERDVLLTTWGKNV